MSFEISSALRDNLFAKKYSKEDFYHDICAGFIVSLIALPLCMALSVAIGLEPEHGIYTSIVAGFFAAVFGGSNYQVSGPTAAFVTILSPIVLNYGLRGLLISQLMAGIIIIIFALIKLGKYINKIPDEIVAGFTAGIAIVIALIACNDLLGLRIELNEGRFLHKLNKIIENIHQVNPYETSLGLLSVLILIFGPKFIKKVPASIIMIISCSVIGYICNKYNIKISTIGNVFSYIGKDGVTKGGIPPFLPHFDFFHGNSQSELYSPIKLEEIKILLIPAITIALLGSLESLLSAKVADKMSNTKHNPTSELFGIGIANIITSLASGIPATGAIARTANNIKNGARTPIAAMMHSIFILLYVLFFSNIISYIPLCSLAAILLVTAYHMSHIEYFIYLLKNDPILSKIILLSSFITTLFIDMIWGVSIGMVVYFTTIIYKTISKSH